ncbi:MAG: KTSC domain-containing protein [Firmicutes bacterium]|nr:KTSC domain-containing protein [Bacillota bacterium]
MYQYFDVRKEQYLGLPNASYNGTYFNCSIRNAYTYIRIK